MNTTQKSLIEICGDVRAGKVTARSRVESYLAAIAAKDAEIHALNEIHADAARAQADAVDAAVKAGRDPGSIEISTTIEKALPETDADSEALLDLLRRRYSAGVRHFVMDFGHPQSTEPVLRFVEQVITPFRAG